MTAKELVAAGYFQISRKYREVARLPEGVTGIQALQRHWREPVKLSERDATDQYLRVYATDKIELSLIEWNDYIRAGGGVVR